MLSFHEACQKLGLSIRAMHVPAIRHHIKMTYAMSPQWLTIHNTANNASALAEISYMNGNDQYVSYHWAVDDKEAIQGIPHNRNAWHCGDGGGQGNMSSIGIEICHSLTPGNPLYPKSEDNGAKLAAVILYSFGWGVDRMTTHQRWSGKYCPHRIFDNGNWQGFVATVQGYLDQLHNKQSKQQAENTITIEPIEEEEIMNFVLRSTSGKQGYVAVINGNVMPIGDIATVHAFKDAGFKHLTLADGDFDRFLKSQVNDHEAIAKAIKEAAEMSNTTKG